MTDSLSRFITHARDEGPLRATHMAVAHLRGVGRERLEPARIRAVAHTRSSVLHQLSPRRYTDADPFRLLSIDPHSVRWSQRPYDHDRLSTDRFGRFEKRENIAKVVGGSWDETTRPWQELSFVEGFSEHFVEGVPWEQTDFFRAVTRDDAALNRRWEGSRWDRLSNEEAVLEELRRFDTLYETIREEGYARTSFFDEVTVNVARDGRLIHNNSGSHRLCLAQILDLDRIPARVLLRHRAWQGRRNAIRAGTVDGVSSHPDLVDVL